MNNEAKARRSTRLEVLGKAKVMSCEDFEEPRANRAAKDKATADRSKGKRGFKRKSSTAEAGARAEVEADTSSSS